MYDEDPKGVLQTQDGPVYTAPAERKGNCMQASVATLLACV